MEKQNFTVITIIAYLYMLASILMLLIGIVLVVVAISATVIALISGEWAAVLVSLPFLGSSFGFFLAGAGLLAVKEMIFLALSIEYHVRECSVALNSRQEPVFAPAPSRKPKTPLGEPADMDEFEDDGLFDDEEIEDGSNDDLFEDEIDPDELNFDEPEQLQVAVPEPVEIEKPKSIALTCPKCKKKANAPIAALGKKVRCSGCETKFVAKQ